MANSNFFKTADFICFYKTNKIDFKFKKNINTIIKEMFCSKKYVLSHDLELHKLYEKIKRSRIKMFCFRIHKYFENTVIFYEKITL